MRPLAAGWRAARVRSRAAPPAPATDRNGPGCGGPAGNNRDGAPFLSRYRITRNRTEAPIVETLVTDIPDDLQERILHTLERAGADKRPLATAESCTGGLLASLFTDVEGYSGAFERGYVVYSTAAKTEMLGVPADLLDAHGAVSRPVAIAMAEGALRRSEAYAALSVTGYAGPGGDDAEEGLVHFACAASGRPTAHREEHFGAVGRSGVRLACIGVAVDLFMEAMR